MSAMKSILEIMVMISGEYAGRFDVTDERVATWEYQLSDIDRRAVHAAAMHFLSLESPHPPQVGQIRKHCIDIRDGALSQISGPDAWVYVLAEIQKHDGSFEGLSQLTRDALRSVGTIFDLKRNDELSFDRGHFLKTYAALAEKEAVERYALPDVKAMANMNAPQLPAKPEPEVKRLNPATREAPKPEKREPFVGAGPVSADVEARMHEKQLQRVANGDDMDFSDPYYRDSRKPSKEEIGRLNALVEKAIGDMSL